MKSAATPPRSGARSECRSAQRDPDRTLRDAEALVQRGFTELLITVKGDDAPRQVDAAAGLLLRKLRG